MLIMCSNVNAATRLYEYLLEEIRAPVIEKVIFPNQLSQLIDRMNTYFFNFVPSKPSWRCSRH